MGITSRRTKRILFLAALSLTLWLQPVVRGEGIVVTVSGPATPVAAGSAATFQINALNTSPQPLAWTCPQEVKCRLLSGSNTLEAAVALLPSAQAGPVIIAPETFAQREFALQLPGSWSGEVTVELRDFPSTRLVLDVRIPSPAVTPAEPPDKGLVFILKGRKLAADSEAYDPDTFFKEHIFGYEPFYFIAGTKSPNAKFQISFKFRLLNERGWIAEKAPWLTGLHLGFSQTSLWDWSAPSAPFFDSSYRPEFLYSRDRLIGGEPAGWFRLDIQGGVQHESNGRDGANSRSMNIAYLRPAFVFGKDSGIQLTLKPRAWAYVGDISDNPDIADYRGYVDLRAVLGWKRGLQVSALGRMGKNGNHPGVQLDMTYPLMQPPYGSFSLYLHAQYFTGYGESLVGYREKTDIFRAGISLYR